MAQASPLKRLIAFGEERDLTQQAFAELLGCDQGYLSKILAGRRRVGFQLATAIELATAEWKGGQIKATDWIAYKLKSRAA